MFRIEIIANHSVEENILESFVREGVGKFYTKYPNVFGVGNSGPRMGDAIWPEENTALVVWCEEDEARGIARAVEEVKKQFPNEGIRIFGLPSQQSRFQPDPVFPEPSFAGAAAQHPQYTAAAAPHTQYTAPVAPAAAQHTQYTAPAASQYTAPAASAAPQTSRPALEPIAPPPGPARTPPVYPPAASAAPPARAAPDSAGINTEYDGQNMDEEH